MSISLSGVLGTDIFLKMWDLKCYFPQLNFIVIKCAMCVLVQPQAEENNVSNCLTPACLM